MLTLVDLTWKPSAAQQTLPTDVYPVLAPAIYRNDNYSMTFELWADEAQTVPYVPEGTFDAQIRSERIKANATVGDPIAEFAVDVGGDDGNEVTFSLTRAQAATIPDQGPFWDAQEVFDDDTARTWFTGKVKAWGDVTREDDGS